MKKILISAGAVVAIALALTLKANNSSPTQMDLLMKNVEAIAQSGESSAKCYQTMGYCYGTGAGINYKCTSTTSAEDCRRYVCYEGCKL